MHQAIKEGISICKTILRNGYDAYVINSPLQESMLKSKVRSNEPVNVEIACDLDFVTLQRLFPNAQEIKDGRALARLQGEKINFIFYPLVSEKAAHPEYTILRLTPTIIANMLEKEPKLHFSWRGASDQQKNDNEGFADVKDCIRILGQPDETLHYNYLLAIRALRLAANYDVPIEANSWMAIVRASMRVLDYVPPRDIMSEWRKVAAESMHRFVRLLYDAHILQGLMPEVAGLASVPQQGDRDEVTENVFEHTLKCMRVYPEEGLHYDWLGTMGMLFHDVGKLFTAEFFDGRWTYYQHHRVGAKITHKILRRLHFDLADADLICNLVNNHMRFHFMMTDRGIRRFKAVGETPRLIAMAKSDLLANEHEFTSFNHNMKYLARADMPEKLLEPLLNGNEIMSVTQLSPGRLVGIIRDALLEAQKNGLIEDRETAVDFVRNYANSINDNLKTES